ncbi:hypothetical protein MGG_16660 [Pyricularia oryzae 70-15]|uniref:Uncharacterized protein n=3 Tax=Pyricularia oryzae TaxID=318829 RepID=G4N2I2_PYRO7|nr:uncharacterized protein MGG_16660 [Pyricularia oryzae 70-15]EHA51691.1 hypothetical protein MGG_16660 [Pyricularia oryzae 70-15]ELQ41420.1 hypothetical protein OOU_Y34scaffold00280g1 [Pyricularia oryzae Y34]KAI7908530.1 hypothetical protein M9X92_012138 [Pyricularia oryzae]KAI7908647.1 hypothetical protein M0657_012198 [Pyricularia oryzae]
MHLSSIVAAIFLAQSAFANPMPSEDPDAPIMLAGNRAASDLQDPDKIPYVTPQETCMKLCRKGWSATGMLRNSEKFCKKWCSDRNNWPK